MAFLTWSQVLSVGVPLFDEQHQRLVRMLNDLHTAMMDGRGKEILGQTLDGLVDYTSTHFTDEERLMAQHGYPELEQHREEHRKLVAQVLELREQHRAGRAALTIEVMAFLKDWLVQHIQGTDRRYGAHFRERGVR